MIFFQNYKTFSVICLVVLFHGCTADDGDEDKCAAQSGKDCHSCLRYAKCYYCTSTQKCTFYPWRSLIPKSDVCSLSQVRWGTCWVNFVALIVSVVVIVLMLAVSVAIWCHLKCRRCRIRSVERDEQRFATERQSRLEMQAQRRTERQAVTDVIRQKYGLATPGSDQPPPYQPL